MNRQASAMAFVVVFLGRVALTRWTPAVVAVAVAALIFAGGLTSGGNFNPARQFGPLLFAERFSYLWAYLLGPVAGAVIAVVLAMTLGLPQPLTCSLVRHAAQRPPSRSRIPPKTTVGLAPLADGMAKGHNPCHDLSDPGRR
jgi:major intrinsic protein